MREIGCQAQHLAVWMIRTALRPETPPVRFRTSKQPDPWQDLAALRGLLRQAEENLAALCGHGLEIAAISQLTLTQDENHLLLAAAAAQAERPLALDAALAALCPCAPQTMEGATATLGAVLATHGYWLPEPAAPPPPVAPLPAAPLPAAPLPAAPLPAAPRLAAPRPPTPLPGPALSAVRHRSAQWRQAEILWP